MSLASATSITQCTEAIAKAALEGRSLVVLMDIVLSSSVISYVKVLLTRTAIIPFNPLCALEMTPGLHLGCPQ